MSLTSSHFQIVFQLIRLQVIAPGLHFNQRGPDPAPTDYADQSIGDDFSAVEIELDFNKGFDIAGVRTQCPGQ